MKVQCKNCLPKEGIELPNFSESDKQKLMKLKLNSGLHTCKMLMNEYNISHMNSKFITTHINATYGKCNNCDFNNLKIEYGKCPQCGALNFNWKIDKE